MATVFKKTLFHPTLGLILVSLFLLLQKRHLDEGFSHSDAGKTNNLQYGSDKHGSCIHWKIHMIFRTRNDLKKKQEGGNHSPPFSPPKRDERLIITEQTAYSVFIFSTQLIWHV